MSQIKPFRAYRPKEDLAASIASVPYDVINVAEARQLSAGNPHSFLRVTRPEVDFPEGVDAHGEPVYAKGAENLQQFIDSGLLSQEENVCFYVYQQNADDHVQTGLVALCAVKECEANLIKKHELTRQDKEDDRARHLLAQNANAEPVFLTYRSVPYIDGIVDKVRDTAPLYDIVTPDGIGHTVWKISDERVIYALAHLFGGVDCLYVADGHHRTAAAVRYAQAKRTDNGSNGSDPCEYFLAVIFPHDQLRIMDYNRVISDLNGLTPDAFLAKVAQVFDVSESRHSRPDQARTFGMYLGGKWYRLEAKKDSFPAGDIINSLDVSILQNNLLGPILGITDPRTDARIDFVGGARGMRELERRVNEGAAVAFAMYPTTVEQLMAVADAGQIMPPKSTWFEPKLRSGLLVRRYEE